MLFHKDVLLDQVITLLVGGHKTTSNLLTFSLYLLSLDFLSKSILDDLRKRNFAKVSAGKSWTEELCTF